MQLSTGIVDKSSALQAEDCESSPTLDRIFQIPSYAYIGPEYIIMYV